MKLVAANIRMQNFLAEEIFFMYGIFSNTSSGRNLKFHQLLAFIAVVGSVVFGVFFIYVVPATNELIWDRIIVFLFSIFLYFFGFKKNIDKKRYVRLVYLNYYLYSIQVVWSMAANDFQLYYVLSFFVTLQACGFSMRQEHETFWYYLFMLTTSMVGLAINDNTKFIDEVIYSGLITGTCCMSFLAARQKCKFMLEMKMNETLMQSMVSKTEDAVFLTDIYGSILDLNGRANELFDYDKKELIDHDFKILRKSELSEEEVKEGLKAMQDEQFWNAQTMLTKKNGDVFHARISITLIGWGRKKYMVYRVQDITDIKNYELQILQEKEKAQEAAKAKAQFLAVMSHEIRTPLNGVIATVSMLQKADLTFEQMEYADTIKRSGDSLLMLINDILEFSKMESGKLELDAHNSMVSDQMFDVIDLLRPHAESKGLQLLLEISNDIPDKLWMDGHRVKQVLLNLVGNAIKFTKAGSVKLKCENLGINKKAIQLKFSVEDTGIGIPEDKMHKLFQSFSQVDSSTSRKFGGTGLGLAISKELVEMMGGEITVSSKDGVGTTFSFTMNCELAREEINKKSDSYIIGVEGPIENMKILVAEDNEINQQVFHFMLESLKIETVFAENGVQAVDACHAQNFDLVFMDMQMPEMDGLEATRIIRSRAGHQPTIVAISANAYTDDRKMCEAAGMNDFMPKPFDLDQLKAMLMKWNNQQLVPIDKAA